MAKLVGPRRQPADAHRAGRAPLPARRPRDRARGDDAVLRRRPARRRRREGPRRSCRTTSCFDRCYLHGDRRRAAPARHRAERRRRPSSSTRTSPTSRKSAPDSQAIAGWNGPGPFRIVNNYLEAAGENVMFGGADPRIPDLVPVRHRDPRATTSPSRCAWNGTASRGYAGTAGAVKNLFELKNARRVVIEGNLLEHNWLDAQNGFAVLFTVRNQDGGAPWSVVEDVTFANNVVRSAAGRDQHPRHATTATRASQLARLADRGTTCSPTSAAALGRQRAAVPARCDGTTDVVDRAQHGPARRATSLTAEGLRTRASSSATTSSRTTSTASTGSGVGPGRHARALLPRRRRSPQRPRRRRHRRLPARQFLPGLAAAPSASSAESARRLRARPAQPPIAGRAPTAATPAPTHRDAGARALDAPAMAPRPAAWIRWRRRSRCWACAAAARLHLRGLSRARVAVGPRWRPRPPPPCGRSSRR